MCILIFDEVGSQAAGLLLAAFYSWEICLFSLASLKTFSLLFTVTVMQPRMDWFF
jgi:hypothetical protein